MYCLLVLYFALRLALHFVLRLALWLAPPNREERFRPLGVCFGGAPASLTSIETQFLPRTRRRRLAGRPAPVNLAVALLTFASRCLVALLPSRSGTPGIGRAGEAPMGVPTRAPMGAPMGVPTLKSRQAPFSA
jgi:hypothetical protein